MDDFCRYISANLLVSSAVIFKSAGWCIVFLLPLALWLMTTQLTDYFMYAAPKGQISYVLSKLFGLYAINILWYQVLSTLLKSTTHRHFFFQWSLERHRFIAVSLILCVLLHISLFFFAVSIRQQAMAWELLWPDFKDFYHAAISLGWFAFVLGIFAIVAIINRHKLNIAMLLHRFLIIAIVLAMVHGFLIGTETQYGWFTVWYLSMAVSTMFAIYIRLRSFFKKHD